MSSHSSLNQPRLQQQNQFQNRFQNRFPLRLHLCPCPIVRRAGHARCAALNPRPRTSRERGRTILPWSTTGRGSKMTSQQRRATAAPFVTITARTSKPSTGTTPESTRLVIKGWFRPCCSRCVQLWWNVDVQKIIKIGRETCGQSYKQFTLVNYDSRVLIWGIFKSGMTLES